MSDLPITEQENERSRGLDTLTIEDTLALINDEDHGVPTAVRRQLPIIAQAVEGIVGRLRRGGRLIYVGTGTSGRLGVLDASECPPTYGVPAELVQGLIAGGYDACHRAVEASEDDHDAGASDLATRGVTAADAVIGIAASGRTPYTVGAVEHARALGAFTVAIACVPGSAITLAAEVAIVPVVGPEVVAGSTRMKAGTAQKLVLNMISTTAMIQLGYVRGNRMTNMRARNSKLQARAVRILQSETGLDDAAATSALEAAGGDVATAVVMIRTGCAREAAGEALLRASGVIERAIASLCD
ncbi:N-acetylmuramic acid 6-phosphate etherase [Luteitalea pratensis]|uniref:N-acetylmuramic acid 6-phosphate etherase n=1 Tax=Luteitalea pratensis TaxID=1855912 RepID=A0A143PLM8_LUTPR|nr:N-acetylmuramic acid 6-phosphate etherase [Luteitalea pratensis]AMY08679.1 N-acetylmuramic acid 6-phosphate etherase [Luteitalea pratensis]